MWQVLVYVYFADFAMFMFKQVYGNVLTFGELFFEHITPHAVKFSRYILLIYFYMLLFLFCQVNYGQCYNEIGDLKGSV